MMTVSLENIDDNILTVDNIFHYTKSLHEVVMRKSDSKYTTLSLDNNVGV